MGHSCRCRNDESAADLWCQSWLIPLDIKTNIWAMHLLFVDSMFELARIRHDKCTSLDQRARSAKLVVADRPHSARYPGWVLSRLSATVRAA